MNATSPQRLDPPAALGRRGGSLPCRPSADAGSLRALHARIEGDLGEAVINCAEHPDDPVMRHRMHGCAMALLMVGASIRLCERPADAARAIVVTEEQGSAACPN